jgi:streptogramin lyase/mono/diheme cytochrome c family protein
MWLRRLSMNRKLWMVAIAGIVSLGSLFGIQSRQITNAAAESGAIPGTGTLSGTVQAPRPFKAARVYARNTDKDILFMVYTSGGGYHAVNLFPGNYEVSVQKKGFTSDVKTVVVKPGASLTVDFSLQVDASPDEVPSVTYDSLYPQGRGRDLAEKTCIVCHGAGFLPRHHWDESQWNAAINRMSNPAAPRIPPGLLDPSDRQDLAAYLASNFGPDSPKRILDVGGEMPLDEQALGKAMYVEYYLPPLQDKGDRLLHDPHFDQEGNVWYTDRGGDRIGKLDPRTGTWKDYLIPDPKAFPHGLTVDSEGYPWWVGNIDLGRIDPKTGKMDIYPIDSTGRRVFHGHTVVVDSKKNVWFTNIIENKLGKWDFQTKKITLWEAPSQNAYPYGVVVDKNDKIWMAEWIRCKFTEFDPVTEKFTEYSPLNTPCVLKRLRIDSKGMIWYADGIFRAGKLGKMDPNTGKKVEYTIPMPFANPYDLSPDGKGSIWMGDDSNLNEPPGGMYFDTTLIRFDEGTQKFTYYPSPQRTAMPKIEVTRDGAIWYCARDAKRQALDVLYPDVTKMRTMAAYY